MIRLQATLVVGVILSFAIWSPAFAQCDGTLVVECEAHDDTFFPVTVSWTNPDEDFVEVRVLRNSIVVATLVDREECYVDAHDDTSGQYAYRVDVLNDALECVATSSSDCLVLIGGLRGCASDDGFEAEEFGDGTDLELTLELRECDPGWGPGQLAAVSLELSINAVNDLTATLTSPEGTSVVLWDGNGGEVDWDEQTLVIALAEEEIPDTVPVDCGTSCSYSAAGPGSLFDFVDEDESGDWTLDLESTVDATLHDWCLVSYSTGIVEVPTFVRGDVDGSGGVSGLVDAFRLLFWGFSDASAPPCLAAADVDGNTQVNALVDTLYLLASTYADGDDPPYPYPECDDPPIDYPVWYGCETLPVPPGHVTCEEGCVP